MIESVSYPRRRVIASKDKQSRSLLAEGASLQEPLFAVTQQELDPINYTKNPMFRLLPIMKDRAGIGADITLRLSTAPDTSTDLWLKMQIKYDLW